MSRGEAFFSQGEFDKALADYNQAIRLAPTVLAFYDARVRAYEAKGDFDAAIAESLRA